MKIRYIVLHHTGAEEKDARHVRKNHLSLGFRDVGYNFIIERNGRVVPGRSLNIPGAHCKNDGMNFRSIGIAVIGNMENHPPTPSQKTSLQGLVKKLAREYSIPKDNILGHREVKGASTLCPGRYFPLAETKNIVETDIWYKVQAGAFKKLDNAKKLQQRLGKYGFESFIVVSRE